MEIQKPELVMLIGLPAAGKSFLTNGFRETGYHIHSSDALRLENYGAYLQKDHAAIFQMLHRNVKADLQNGISCVYDATNLSRKRRRATLQELGGYVGKRIAIVVLAPVSLCEKRNKGRPNEVSDGVIQKKLRQFEVPYYYEGWDEIRFVYNAAISDVQKELERFAYKNLRTFDQDNPHHTETLGMHMKHACLYADRNGVSPAVVRAAMYHDIGKVFTKDFVDSRGNPTEIAHYYGHENAGAYYYLLKTIVENGDISDEHLYIANLINWHMRPLVAWRNSEKARQNDRQLMGEEMYADILRLNAADVHAH